MSKLLVIDLPDEDKLRIREAGYDPDEVRARIKYPDGAMELQVFYTPLSARWYRAWLPPVEPS